MIGPSQLTVLAAETRTQPHAAPLLRLPQRRRRVRDAGEVSIRVAGRGDADVVCELEQLDGHRLAPGTRLIAELGGVPVAAAAIADGTVVADPFLPTAAVADLLRTRARQLRPTAA